MKIELHEIPVRDVFAGYANNEENGVVGYDGKLNIRPKYQREFVYKPEQRNAVIETVRKGFPLNVMYWARNQDGTCEVLDGQQRLISICEYVEGNFSVEAMEFHNLTSDEQEHIRNYKLMIYFCEGTDREKLDWFETINIAGAELTAQELRNAVYTGEWLTDAKRWFSKTGCPAYDIAKGYLDGTPIRQDYLQTALRWISDKKTKDSDNKIREYMAAHQHDHNASALWVYFQNVINWVKTLFPEYRKEMKGVEWGELYNRYKDHDFDPVALEAEVARLIQDEDVTSMKGIYIYLITGEEKHLNLRAFKDSVKRVAYEQQDGVCLRCKDSFEIDEMEADHITPWRLGGRTIPENCQMLCRHCNRTKAGK